MKFSSAQPYSKRPVPKPEGYPSLQRWATSFAAWIGLELGNVQRGFTSASSRTVTTNTTALVTDGLILADATTAPLTVTLPSPNLVHDMAVTIKRLNGGANAVTIGGTVDGVVNPTLGSQYAAMTVWADISANPAGAWYKVATV